MPGTLTASQMYDNELNAVKGWWSPYALDKSADRAAAATGIVGGKVVSLDANGEFVLGLSSVNAMAIFALQGQNDFDANSEGGNGAPSQNISGGKTSGLVATGGYEVETTEFDAGGTYSVNAHLTADASGDVTNGTVYTDAIVGVVSDAGQPRTNEWNKQMVRFWTVYLPPTP